MFEFFEHTADLGIRVVAPDLNTLFEEAAKSLFSLIVHSPETIRPLQLREFEFSDNDLSILLRDWLDELLFLFDSEQLLFARFEVRIDENRLSAQARGEPFVEQRHELEHEVKAITYHGLCVRQLNDNWEAEVIVDI